MRFTIWSLDVWGNAAEGFEVNDRCKVGTVEIADQFIDLPADQINALPTPAERQTAFHEWGIASDKGIRAALVEAGYLTRGVRIVIDGDDHAMSIDRESNGCPLLQRERE